MKTLIKLIALAALTLVLNWPSHAANSVTGTVNINTASATELALLPGIGDAKAQAIMAQRLKKPFSKKEELLLIKGIGDTLFAKLSPYVSLDGQTTLKVTPAPAQP